MPETPRHISEKIDQIIDRLNSTWNLQLPRLYGPEARKSVNDQKAVARRCSSRIRYLCFRSETGIENAITEFEEEAKTIFSKWVWKPSQERGTLPSLPTGESFLKRDIMSGMNGPISTRLREALVQKLSTILDDEYTLAHESDSYQRTSSQSFNNSLSRTTSFGTAMTGRTRTPSPKRSLTQENQRCLGDLASSKRSNQSSQHKEEKRRKTFGDPEVHHDRNAKVGEYFRKSKRTTPQQALKPKMPLISGVQAENIDAHSTGGVKMTQDQVTSFNTSISPTPSVFTNDPEDAPNFSQSTSVMDCEDEISQDLFPTQDATEYFADESFSSEFHAANAKSASALQASIKVHDQTTAQSSNGLSVEIPNAIKTNVFSFDDLCTASPFQQEQHLPSHLPYWIRWEIYRVAQTTGLQPLVLYNGLRDSGNDANITYSQLWKNLGGVCSMHSKLLPAKSDIRPWMEETNTYQSPDGKMPYFTFDLEYEQEQGPRLWKMSLNPIKIDQGNRIHRKFGADRHLMGFLNYFDEKSLPKWIKRQRGFDADDLFRRIAAWLAVKTHHAVGRQWRAFFLEPEKKKKRQTDEAPRQKLSFFAIDGDDFDHSPFQTAGLHTPVSIETFVNWHIPLHENRHSTDLKLFSRFGLGLSKTKSTVLLEPRQFRYIPVKYRSDPEGGCIDMQDGCALMSWSMGKAVWDICGDGTHNVPSVFQGRIAGAKGTWIIDYRDSDSLGSTEPWIEIGESQLKIQPQPQLRLDADETQRTFEVLKWSSPCVPGHLNMQLINILADRGVSRATLRQVVLNDIEEYIQASRGAMRDPRLLLGWLQDYHSGARNESPPSFDHGLPDGKEERANFLVQSGFTAENCEFLRKEITLLITQTLDMYVEKLRIKVPCSTSTFCVPDPYQVLEEDEVHLAFSEHWTNPRTGFREFALSDVDVLVARNPAALASDIQKRKAVYKHELRHFKDVIVFPTKGKLPLASLLSGGDYDGDTVTVIWTPELVDTFCNVEKPDLPTEEQCGLKKVSCKLQDEVGEFMTACITFNAQPNRVGLCTNEHEKLVYSGAKLSDPGAVTLAALAGYLVDANKQGLLQSAQSWQEIRRTAFGGRKVFNLAYKKGQEMPRRMDSGECVNIMDHLKFDVARKRKEEILVEFERMLPNAAKYDIQLSALYNQTLEQRDDREDKEREGRAAIRDHLKASLEAAEKEWQKRSSRRERFGGKSTVTTDIQFISNLIKQITPSEQNCDAYRDCCSDLGREGAATKGTRWSLIRASAMYKLFPWAKITWWTVGDELGRIKARAQGMTIETRPDMHFLLKTDTKCIKKLTGETAIEDGFESDDHE